MNLLSRLQRIEKLAHERAVESQRKSRKGFRHVIIYEGVEPTPEQREILKYNNSISGTGVGFRCITVRCQHRKYHEKNAIEALG
jgi:hypothetical protein